MSRRFTTNDTAADLAAMAGDFLRTRCDASVLTAAWDGQRSEQLWIELGELGAIAAGLAEPSGGLGLGAGDLIPLVEEVGYSALPFPFIESGLVGPALLPGAHPLLPEVMSGAARVAVAEPTGLVRGLDGATHLMVADSDGVRLQATGALPVTEVRPVDRGMSLHRVVGPLGGSEVASPTEWTRARRRAALFAAGELVGLSRSILDETVAYARERTQFGTPIGRFQAIKHALADVLIELELTRPVVVHAAARFDDAPDAEATLAAIAHAKLRAGRLGRHAGRVGIEVHGAIGYSFEYGLQRWVKRAWALDEIWGSGREQLATLSRLGVPRLLPQRP
jgi:alkylation response protein AidB-like acyl-CoA dehydrogenase